MQLENVFIYSHLHHIRCNYVPIIQYITYLLHTWYKIDDGISVGCNTSTNQPNVATKCTYILILNTILYWCFSIYSWYHQLCHNYSIYIMYHLHAYIVQCTLFYASAFCILLRKSSHFAKGNKTQMCLKYTAKQRKPFIIIAQRLCTLY